MPESRRAHLDELVERWQARRLARGAAADRPLADVERERLADSSFPWRTQTPAVYAARHGAAMIGYAYDAYAYRDRALETWLRELGDILRAGEGRG